MAADKPKPWQTSSCGRREGTRNRRRVLIVCEDTKSSCLYFRAFNIDPERAEVITLGTGMNTDSLVEEASRMKAKAVAAREPYNQVWCVLDRDDFPLAKYERGFALARSAGMYVAWVNQAFELWYLLHFNYHDTGISRHDYKAKLEAFLPVPYDKTDPEMYQKVFPHQRTALQNARKLEKHWSEMGERFPHRQNPSTSMHKLVEFLNELVELGAT
jgi:RloB-like protein